MRQLLQRATRKVIEIERLLDSRMNSFVRPSSRRLEPIEVRNAILDTIEDQIIAGPKGTPLFPYDEVVVELLERSAPPIEVVLESGGGLQAAARQRLTARDCRVGSEVVFQVRRMNDVPPDWPLDAEHRLRFNRKAADQAPIGCGPSLALTLTFSVAGQPRSHSFTSTRIDVGRVAEVRDRAGRLLRRNVLPLGDEYDPNLTVSRRHAHIKAFTDPGGRTVYVLRDDASRYGTRVVRDGKTIPVHPGTAGVHLRDGDELYFGSARALIRLGDEPAADSMLDGAQASSRASAHRRIASSSA
jgi:hypothetical protein